MTRDWQHRSPPANEWRVTDIRRPVGQPTPVAGPPRWRGYRGAHAFRPASPREPRSASPLPFHWGCLLSDAMGARAPESGPSGSPPVQPPGHTSNRGGAATYRVGWCVGERRISPQWSRVRSGGLMRGFRVSRLDPRQPKNCCPQGEPRERLKPWRTCLRGAANTELANRRAPVPTGGAAGAPPGNPETLHAPSPRAKRSNLV